MALRDMLWLKDFLDNNPRIENANRRRASLKRQNRVILWFASVLGSIVFVLALTPYLPCAILGLGEYLRPTSTVPIPLRQTLFPTDQAPSPEARSIIESQAEHYHLALQSIAVYRSSLAKPQSENEFAAAFFSPEVRQRWLPAYVGCCTYSFRRHYAIIVVENGGDGSTLVAATLIQNRWDYIKFLRLHCDEKLKSWL